jgi:hypothetical protein
MAVESSKGTANDLICKEFWPEILSKITAAVVRPQAIKENRRVPDTVSLWLLNNLASTMRSLPH